jgi:acyl carrier protein
MVVDPVLPRVRGFVLAHFPLARKRSVGDQDPLLSRGIVDSLGILDLVGFVEREFGIKVADDELLPEHFESIANIARFVDKKLANNGRNPSGSP